MDEQRRKMKKEQIKMLRGDTWGMDLQAEEEIQEYQRLQDA